MMRKNGLLFMLGLLGLVGSCKTTNLRDSDLSSAPKVNGAAISQSGQWPVNLCNQGGFRGPTAGTGWTYDARMGCYLDCPSEDVAKDDFLAQLKRHRVYGDLSLLAANDPDGAAAASYYQKRENSVGLNPPSFANVTRDQLFRGSRWRTLPDTIKPCDILLNMAFGTPNRAGAFYSKRGFVHAEMVVKVTDDTFATLDGGWDKFSIWHNVAAQTVWLRPKSAYFTATDLNNVLKWAAVLQKAGYDNLLADDWRDYRNTLNQLLDSGTERTKAAQQAFAASQTNNFAPFGFAGSFNFVPPSGLYCSEGVTAIFSYLGYRQYGDTPIQMATAFSPTGDLPDWAVYADALEGFGANEGKVLTMHRTLWTFFSVFDQARKLGWITIPGYPNAAAGSFAQAITANLQAVAADQGKGDHIQKQIDAIVIAARANGMKNPALISNSVGVQGGFARIIADKNKTATTPINISQFLYGVFMQNEAFGPHTFFENTKYFEFKGVFYNTDPQGDAARFVADLDQAQGPKNISTTMYRISSSPTVPKDRCVIAEPAPANSTMEDNN